ncbi:MAG: ABC transporter substrate-binding protein, partial [Gammaproteobacteria bacterium]|nr:ABC transporter substrate-binding protein [Gammaproteobacteria bacterium]
MKTFLYLALLLYSQLSWATPPEKITLQLHWKHQFEYAGYYIAKEKGYYRDAGLEVVLKELPRGRTEMELLLAGEADYAITGSNVLVDRIHGEPLVAVAAYTQYSPIALLVREDSGIRTVEDLRGKRIMVSKDNLTIFAMLNQAGLQSSDYTIQPQSFNLQDLVNGKTDAFAAFTTNQGFLLKEQGVSYRYIVPTDFGIDTYSDVLITTEQEAT